MAKQSITNNAEGARGVALADGTTHFVEPGQTVSLDVADGHTLYDGLVAGKGGKAAADDGAAEPGPLDGSITELREHIAGVEDAEAIQALIDAETGGKSRAGALAALNERLDELKDEG